MRDVRWGVECTIMFPWSGFEWVRRIVGGMCVEVIVFIGIDDVRVEFLKNESRRGAVS